MKTPTPKERLEYLRGELRAERISYGELHELQSLAKHIEPDDVELLQAAGVPESAASFTPGPWTVGHSETNEPAIRADKGSVDDACIAVCCELLEGEAQANARLIASAPELLEALQECIAWFDLDTHRNHPIMAHDTEIGFRMIQKIRAAIAKAKRQK